MTFGWPTFAWLIPYPFPELHKSVDLYLRLRFKSYEYYIEKYWYLDMLSMATNFSVIFTRQHEVADNSAKEWHVVAVKNRMKMLSKCIH